MRELTNSEVTQVSGGLGPLVVIGVDLALNGLILGYAAIAMNGYYYKQR